MKLAMSHIAWSPEEEDKALAILQKHGFAGLEIAPPRVAGPTPYAFPEKGAAYAKEVKKAYGLALCSLQSMWFGRQGSMFGPERDALLEYTQSAILFAGAAGIANLVFGNPKNRVLPQGAAPEQAIPFFKQAGDFAAAHGAVVALEANPPVYGTNFMNHTADAFALAQQVDSPGCRVNLDFGTMIINGEEVASLEGRVEQIHHVHISEAQLAMIEKRRAHRQLAVLLQNEGYKGYVSVEMKGQPLANVERAAAYLAEVFA